MQLLKFRCTIVIFGKQRHERHGKLLIQWQSTSPNHHLYSGANLDCICITHYAVNSDAVHVPVHCKHTSSVPMWRQHNYHRLGQAVKYRPLCQQQETHNSQMYLLYYAKLNSCCITPQEQWTKCKTANWPVSSALSVSSTIAAKVAINAMSEISNDVETV